MAEQEFDLLQITAVLAAELGAGTAEVETDAAARRLFTTPQQRFLGLIRNQPVELLPPVDAMAPLWTEWEHAAVESMLGAAIVGSDATVKAGLEKLVAEAGASEVVIATDIYGPQERLESYRRVTRVSPQSRLLQVIYHWSVLEKGSSALKTRLGLQRFGKFAPAG